MVRRYAQDVFGFMKELARVAKRWAPAPRCGNSCLKGVPISNADINVAAAKLVGIRCDRSLGTLAARSASLFAVAGGEKFRKFSSSYAH